jgi:hypothetical protein
VGRVGRKGLIISFNSNSMTLAWKEERKTDDDEGEKTRYGEAHTLTVFRIFDVLNSAALPSSSSIGGQTR